MDSIEKVWIFEETFIFADTNIELVLEIRFLFFSNVTAEFAKKLGKLILRSYGTIKTLQTIKRVKLIDKGEFVWLALDKNFKNFVVYVATLENTRDNNITIHPLWAAQIVALQ